MDFSSCLLKVQKRQLFIQHGRIGGYFIFLRFSGYISLFKKGDGLHQALGAQFFHPLIEFSGGFILPDRDGSFEDHVPSVQPFPHKHGGNAGLLFSVDNAPLDGARSPILGQQRTMYIDTAKLRNLQHRFGQDLAIGDYHNKLRGKLAQLGYNLLIFEGLRLKYRQLMLHGQLLHRRKGHLVASSFRLIRLGIDSQDLMSPVD